MKKLKTFRASSYKEVIEKVKREVGDEAKIVMSKELKKATLNSPGLYEIVVEIDENEVKEDDIFANSVREETSSLIEIEELKSQIKEISDTLKYLQATIWSFNKNELEIPPEFSEIYALAKASGIIDRHLDEIMRLTIKYMPIKMRKNREAIKKYFYTLLRKMIPIRVEREVSSPHKKILMFVGPTGVGKTTNIAKLAARYAYKMSRRYKVGIITLDTYRIGAVEQLMSYAKMMRLPIEAVIDPMDFEEALNSLKHNDYILIDTVGSSQHDREKIEKLSSFLKVNTFSQININLVLSAVTKYEDLMDIYKSFSILPIDTLIFTKLDETKTYGNLFSFLLDTKKPVSYFSIGQEVPDDLIEASADYLLKGILEKEFN